MIDYFPEFMIEATVSRTTTTNVSGVRSDSTSRVGTIQCLFWEGASAEQFISERFRDKTSAVMAISPDDTILAGDTVEVNGKTYHALDSDNVGAAGQAKIVALEVFS